MALNDVSLIPWSSQPGFFGSALTPSQMAVAQPTALMNMLRGGPRLRTAYTDPTIPVPAAAGGQPQQQWFGAQTPTNQSTMLPSAQAMLAAGWLTPGGQPFGAQPAAPRRSTMVGRNVSPGGATVSMPTVDITADPSKIAASSVIASDPSSLTNPLAATDANNAWRFANDPNSSAIAGTIPAQAITANGPGQVSFMPLSPGNLASGGSLGDISAHPGLLARLMNSFGGIFGDSTLGNSIFG